MNKLIKSLLIVPALFLGTTLFAQDNADLDDRVTFGLKAGVNSSNVYDEKGDDFEGEAKLGFVAGAFVGIPIGDFIGIQPEVLYSQKGFGRSGSILLQNYQFTRTTNHLDIPIQLQIRVIPALTILAGPQFSYILSKKDELEINGQTSGNVQDFDNTNLRKNSLGFVGGLDVNISRLVIGARVGWDLQDNKGDGTSTNPRYKNRWVQLTAGVRF
jgi:hypothetical protein